MTEIENLKLLKKEAENHFRDYKRTAEEREIILNKELATSKEQAEKAVKDLEEFKGKFRDCESSMEKMKAEHAIKADTFRNELKKISDLVNDLAKENDSLKRQIEIFSDSSDSNDKMR